MGSAVGASGTVLIVASLCFVELILFFGVCRRDASMRGDIIGETIGDHMKQEVEHSEVDDSISEADNLTKQVLEPEEMNTNRLTQ